MKIHHIGYLVKKPDKAAESFIALGYTPEGERCYDSGRDVDIQFLCKDGYRVELVSPRSEKSVVANLIKTYKNAPYHICYQTEDMDGQLAALEQQGFVRMDEPGAAPAIGGKRVCFLYSARIGMIEILEA